MTLNLTEKDYFKRPTYANFRKLGEDFFAHNESTPENLQAFSTLVGRNREAFRDMLLDLSEDKAALEDMSTRSYSHQLGNDKIVLLERECDLGNGQTGDAKLRLHLYSRRELESWETRHSHQFGLGSCFMTGRGQHDSYRLTDYQAIPNSVAPAAETQAPLAGIPQKPVTAYNVYSDVLDADGELIDYKREYIGDGTLQKNPVQIRDARDPDAERSSWRMGLPEVHRFSTAAERYTDRIENTFNPEFTSTFFVQGPRRDDAAGRKKSMAFIDGTTPVADEIFPVGPTYSPSALEATIRSYVAVLSADIEHERFVKDNGLQVGEVVNALLANDYKTTHPFRAKIRNSSAFPDIDQKINGIKAELAELTANPDMLKQEPQDERTYFLHRLHREISLTNETTKPEQHDIKGAFEQYTAALDDLYTQNAPTKRASGASR